MDEFKTANALFNHPYLAKAKDRESGAIESAEMWAKMPNDHIDKMLSDASERRDWWQWRFEYELARIIHEAGREFPGVLAQRMTATHFNKNPNKNCGQHATRDAQIAFVVAYLVKEFSGLSATRNDASTIDRSACDVVARVKHLSYDSVKKIWITHKDEAKYIAKCVGEELPLISLPMP